MAAALSKLSTRVLLVCAAIGVVCGILSAAAGWVTPALLAVFPIGYGLLLGSHVMPGIIAQELLRLPGVALLAHTLAALIASAIAPHWFLQFLGTGLAFGLIQELCAAVTRYRSWRPWRFFLSALPIAAVIAAGVWFASDLPRLTLPAQVLALGLAVASPIAWTGIALWIGAALRSAGLGWSQTLAPAETKIIGQQTPPTSP